MLNEGQSEVAPNNHKLPRILRAASRKILATSRRHNILCSKIATLLLNNRPHLRPRSSSSRACNNYQLPAETSVAGSVNL
jgi:hypothetical protein